jgi:hypothetical protein
MKVDNVLRGNICNDNILILNVRDPRTLFFRKVLVGVQVPHVKCFTSKQCQHNIFTGKQCQNNVFLHTRSANIEIFHLKQVAPYLTGENLDVVCAKFSSLKLGSLTQ